MTIKCENDVIKWTELHLTTGQIQVLPARMYWELCHFSTFSSDKLKVNWRPTLTEALVYPYKNIINFVQNDLVLNLTWLACHTGVLCLKRPMSFFSLCSKLQQSWFQLFMKFHNHTFIKLMRSASLAAAGHWIPIRVWPIRLSYISFWFNAWEVWIFRSFAASEVWIKQSFLCSTVQTA